MSSKLTLLDKMKAGAVGVVIATVLCGPVLMLAYKVNEMESRYETILQSSNISTDGR